MEERLKFIARLLDGDKMAVLCREFDISRKTGYKISRATTIAAGRTDGLVAPALSPRQSASVSNREADRAAEAGQADMGCAEDTRTVGPAVAVPLFGRHCNEHQAGTERRADLAHRARGRETDRCGVRYRARDQWTAHQGPFGAASAGKPFLRRCA